MMARKIRLLALHGKGTSARIMKAQIKPLIDALGDLLEVHYMDGGEISAPYQGIESIFPNEPYYAWYQQPTRDALQAAHSRVAERLSPTLVASSKPYIAKTVPITTNFARNGFGILTPPETPTSATSASPVRKVPYQPAAFGTGRDLSFDDPVARRRLAFGVPGIDTPLSYPSTTGVRTPLDSESVSYDGMICFSQGCAVSTGLLLEMGSRLGGVGGMAIRLVILICGGRPFDAEGTLERVDPTSVTPIAVPSIHIHGRLDAGLHESKKLASLYSDKGKQVVELDIGHCPPRRTSDVKLVAAAIRSAISEQGVSM